jgi:hypothetical protein
MDDRKPKPARPMVIRSDGRRWHWDESDVALQAAYRSALERARLWDLRFTMAVPRRRSK